MTQDDVIAEGYVRGHIVSGEDKRPFDLPTSIVEREDGMMRVEANGEWKNAIYDFRTGELWPEMSPGDYWEDDSGTWKFTMPEPGEASAD